MRGMNARLEQHIALGKQLKAARSTLMGLAISTKPKTRGRKYHTQLKAFDKMLHNLDDFVFEENLDMPHHARHNLCHIYYGRAEYVK